MWHEVAESCGKGYGFFMVKREHPGDSPQAGIAFRDMRIASGVTAEAVAVRAGISASHLSRFERGQRPVARSTYWRLVSGLASLMREKAHPGTGTAA